MLNEFIVCKGDCGGTECGVVVEMNVVEIRRCGKIKCGGEENEENQRMWCSGDECGGRVEMSAVEEWR